MGKSVDLDDVIRSVAAYFRGRSASVVSALKGIRGAGTSTVRRVLTHSQDDGPRISGRRAVRRNIAVRRALAVQYATKVKTEKCRRYPVNPSCRAVVCCLRKQDKIKVGRETVRRDLTKGGLAHYVRPKITFKSSAKRLAFVNTQVTKTKRELEAILFSDEHYVNVNDHGSRGCWSGKKGGPVPKDVVPRQILRWSNVVNLQMWAAIGLNYKSEIVFFPKKKDSGANWKMDSKQYIDLCLTKANIDEWNRRGFTFMQDGAKAHTAKIVSAHLAANQVDTLENWPAESPDLNPIENLWSHLNTLIDAELPRTMSELIAATKVAWDSISLRTVNKFVRSFAGKCEAFRTAVREPDDAKVPRKQRADKGRPRAPYKKKA